MSDKQRWAADRRHTAAARHAGASSYPKQRTPRRPIPKQRTPMRPIPARNAPSEGPPRPAEEELLKEGTQGDAGRKGGR